jgi:hypothetical protein
VAVFSWQFCAACPRALPASGDVRVLGEEQRLVAMLLDQTRDRPRANRVMSREVSDSELDSASLFRVTRAGLAALG